MIILILIAAPPGLRGHVTRWLVEVAAGIFVGRLTRPAQDKLWKTVTSRIGAGQATIIRPAANEQRWASDTTGVDRWATVDLDGVVLLRRPTSLG